MPSDVSCGPPALERFCRLAACLGLLSLCSACSGTSAPQPAATNPPPQSAVNRVVEDLTGKTAVDAGRAAQEKIRQVSAERNKDLEAAMGE